MIDKKLFPEIQKSVLLLAAQTKFKKVLTTEQSPHSDLKTVAQNLRLGQNVYIGIDQKTYE